MLSCASTWATPTSPQRFAAQVNAFCAEHLNPYLNFHRLRFFAVDNIDAKGKITKRYPQDQIRTPFDLPVR